MPDSPRIEELKRRVQLDPASIAFAALAEEFRRTGRNEEAIEVCRTGLQRHPSYISAHVTLGRALFAIGQYDDARRELEYVLSVAPENLAAIRGLAEIHHRQGQSSSESTDMTATEMANMLAVPRPSAPQANSYGWQAPPAPVAEPPGPPPPPPVHAPPPVQDRRMPQPEPQRAPEPPVIELVQPEPPVLEVVEPEPAVIEIVEPEPSPVETFRDEEPVFEIVQPPVMAALPPASAPIVTAFEPPKPDPALERLEAFLHAVLRARESAGGIHIS